MSETITIRWNAKLVNAASLNAAVNATLKKVEDSIMSGVREGANQNINDGKQVAKNVLKANSIEGGVLFNSIRTQIEGKNYFYLLAGYGMQPRQRYPLYIEKGFRAHFVSIRNLDFLRWLQTRANPQVLATALSRGGLIVGRSSKWRTGIGFMAGAYNYMTGTIKPTMAKNILLSIQKSLGV